MPNHGAKSEGAVTHRRYTKILQRVLPPMGRLVDDSLLDESATVLGALADGQLDLRGEHELGAVYEFARYEVRRDGETVVGRYARMHPPNNHSQEGRVGDARGYRRRFAIAQAKPRRRRTVRPALAVHDAH